MEKKTIYVLLPVGMMSLHTIESIYLSKGRLKPVQNPRWYCVSWSDASQRAARWFISASLHQKATSSACTRASIHFCICQSAQCCKCRQSQWNHSRFFWPAPNTEREAVYKMHEGWVTSSVQFPNYHPQKLSGFHVLWVEITLKMSLKKKKKVHSW